MITESNVSNVPIQINEQNYQNGRNRPFIHENLNTVHNYQQHYSQIPLFPMNQDSGTTSNNNSNNISQIQQFMDLLTSQQKLTQQVLNQDRPNNTERGLRVPEISLPIFNGDFRKKSYKFFKTSFDSVVSRIKTTTIERYALLRSRLDGNALAAINTLTLTEGNYKRAWEILDKRFDNPRVSIESNIEILATLPPTAAQDAEAILTFMQTYQGALQNLSDLGTDLKACINF